MVENVLVSASLLPLKLSPFRWGGLTSILPWNLQSESGCYRNNTRAVAHWAMTMVCGYSLFLLCLTWEQKLSVRTVHGSSCPDTFIHSFSLKVLDIFQVVLADRLKKSHFFHFALLPPTQDGYFLEMKQVASRPHIASARLCHIPWIIFPEPIPQKHRRL